MCHHCGTRPSSRVRARAPPVQHLLRGGHKRGLHAFQGGQRHHGRFGTPEEKKGGGGEATAGESVLATPLWGMLYADVAGVVSQSPEQPRKMMGVIVVVCAAFGLTVSEAKTEIMRLRAKGMPESTAIFSVEAAGQVYNQTNEFVYLGGNVNRNADLSIEVDRCIRNACAPLELRTRMLRAEILETMLYGCVTWSPRGCHYYTLRRVYHAFLTRCIGWRKQNRADHPISYLDTLIKTESESIEATLHRRRILFAGLVARMEDTRLPKCVMLGELVGARAMWGARKKSGWGVSWTASELSASTPTSGRLQSRTRGKDAGRRNKGAERFMAKWMAAEKARAGLRHTVVCPNMTRRVKERIAPSKRARAGSLAIVDYLIATSGANLYPLGKCRLVFLWYHLCFVSFSSLCFR